MLRPVPPLPRKEPKAASPNGAGPAPPNTRNGSTRVPSKVEESGGRGLEIGAAVWVSDPSQVWTAGEVTKSTSSHVVVKLNSADSPEDDLEDLEVPHTGSKVRLLRRDATIVDAAALQYDDLTNVPELHEAALLQAIADRFQRGRIYTLTGPVLLAVNPFRHMPGLYSPEMLRSFVAEKLQPHIFSIANRAYQGILDHDESQTVLVSGESGAGKTETTKFVMHFLALTGAEAVVSEGEKPLSRVERQVLRSNPLLEAFGNAQTLRNHNSSRFGKYIELQFGFEDGLTGSKKRLIGTRIRTYLLETVRVIDHQPGERSFHIFYQALATSAHLPELDSVVTEHLGKIEGISCFKNLGNSKCSELLDDTGDFQATLAAMQTMGFHAHEIADVLRAVLAVLHVGNIEFAVPAKNSEASEVLPSAGADDLRAPLDEASELLGLSGAQLAEVLCYRTMQAPGEQVIRMGNTTKQAAECRDALGRHLYHALFKHIVEKTNASIGFKPEATFCGVLDIFGFEFFKVNSFEQLCINFTNELLQQYFNNFIFENETILYQEEGVPWQDEDFPDNAGIVKLLQSSPSGIFPMLDEECFVIGGTSGSWHRKLIQTHQNHPSFGVVKLQNSTFIVKHFAGPVTYTVDGFLEKNRDRLSQDLVRCLAGSDWPFVRNCFKDSAENPVSRSPSIRGSPLSSNSPKVRAHRSTVSSEFRQQLQELMGQIRTTTPHFVRCIKPNAENRAFVDAAVPDPRPLFDRSSVAEQLSYQGVLEAIRVARAGYPVRYYHFDFLAAFRCIARKDVQLEMEAAMRKFQEGVADGFLVECIRRLLESEPLRSACENAVAVGRTRVFLKQSAAGRLRVAQALARAAACTRLQARYRGNSARQRAAVRRRAVKALQAAWRGVALRRRLKEERRARAASLIVAGFSTLVARRRLRCVRFVCTALQSLVRMRACRKEFARLRQATCRIQAWWRSWLRRRRMRELPKHLRNIQRCWRGAVGRRQAADFRLGLFRLKRALRRLLRLRWAALKHRKWRQGVMANYRGASAQGQPLAKAELLQKLLQLEAEHALLERQAAILRQDHSDLKTSLVEAKSSSFLRVFGLV
eukprot:s629_g27.t1